MHALERQKQILRSNLIDLKALLDMKVSGILELRFDSVTTQMSIFNLFKSLYRELIALIYNFPLKKDFLIELALMTKTLASHA